MGRDLKLNLHRRQCVCFARAAGLTLLVWMSIFTPVGRAERNYQTVPTMPPPIKTPTVTSTIGIYPSPSNSPRPSATRIPATSTAIAIATQTSVTATATQSKTPFVTMTTQPLFTQGAASEVITPTKELTATITQGHTPTVNQGGGGGGANNTWVYGLIGGGVVLISVMVVALIRSARVKGGRD